MSIINRERTLGGFIFDIFNTLFLAGFAVLTLLPFLHIVACSFATTEEILKSKFLLFTFSPTLDTFRYIFSTSTLGRSLLITIFITVSGTFINMFTTVTMAYGLAHEFPGRNIIMSAIVFTMLFSAGLIPNYLLIKSLGMLDTYWSLLIPGAINTFNLIIIKNAFQQLPAGLEESARIDGANDLVILVKIVLPISMPIIATFTLFYAVGHWNEFMSPLLCINDASKWPVQVLLRQIVLLSQGGIGDSSQLQLNEIVYVPPQTVKMASILVSTVPILLVYPFFQKHFAKGVMVGSIKG